ncbi:MAG: MCP four helix bundle domain-containing protein [Spirochaetaceae bacterium]|nr:MCP four helix bundle domain-containing protein [Spirochaetaceae bacterium]
MALRLKIRSRLLIGFLVVAFFGLVMGFLGMFYVGSLSKANKTMFLEATEPFGRLITLYETVESTQVLVRDLVIAEDPRAVETFLAELKAKDLAVKTAVERLAAQVKDERLQVAVGTFLPLWSDYLAASAFIADEVAAGRFHNLGDVMKTSLGSSAEALKGMMTMLIEGFLSVAADSSEASAALSTRVSTMLAILALVGLAASILIGILLARSVARGLELPARATLAVAAGDLSQAVDAKAIRRSDEAGDLARAVETMRGDLHAHMRTIRASVDTLANVGGELAASMGRVDATVADIRRAVDDAESQIVNQSAGVEQTAATVREMAATIGTLDREIEGQSAGVAASSASIEEMVGNVASIGQSVERLGSSFARLIEAAEDGKAKLQAVTGLIEDVSSQSDKLREANQVVSGIAAKTNLLAMNAAIEAAHAGDAGRGFAVVADEIRGLAESAATQSKEISRDIVKIRGSIEQAVGGAGVAREAFATVVELLRSVSELERGINASLREQQEGSRQALEGLEAINSVTAKVRAGSAELLEGSKAIGTEMGELERATVALRDAATGIGRSIAAIAEASRGVEELSGRNRRAIEAVEGLLARYVLASEEAVPELGPESPRPD